MKTYPRQIVSVRRQSMLDNARRWALRKARRGFTPNAASVKDLLVRLEGEGLVHRLENYPVWYLTDEGREYLDAPKDANKR